MDEIRLIDANALKEDLKQYFSDGTLESVSAKLAFNMVLRKIDDVPTVEITETEIQEVLNKRCMTAVANEYLVALHGGRPHGEWIVKVERRGFYAGDKTVYSYTCPFCGKKEFDAYEFCRCGADMRPEKKIQTPSCLTNPERQAELLERYKEE